MNKLFTSFVVFLFLFSIEISAQTLSPEKITIITQLSKEYFPDNKPGAAVLISIDGEIKFLSAFGLSDAEKSIPMKSDDVFRIGSITKQFTAAAILKLIEENKISLNDDITKFIPDFPTHGKTITIEHLLTHTSGIKSYTSMSSFDEETMKRNVTTTELIDFFKDQPMDFEPGERWLYNNSGYVLLGYIIEQVSGKSYCEFIQSEFFTPLGMTNSYCGDVPELINGYKSVGEDFIPAKPLDLSWPYAAGMLLSTVEDLNKWNNAIMNGNVLSSQSLKNAFTVYTLNEGKPTAYGYGWIIGYLQDLNTIEHSGGINGFVTNAIYIPEYKTYVVVLSNIEKQNATSLSEKIAAIVLDRPYEYKEIMLDEIAAEEYTGVYVDEDDVNRIIFYEDGEFYSQRYGGQRLKIGMYEKDKFFFEDSMTKYEFIRDGSGNITGIKMFHRMQPVSILTKSDEEVETKKSIAVDESILQKYIGEYEISPTFLIVVTVEDGKIYTQPTSQSKLQLHPQTETKFFLKEVDAQIEFILNESGEVSKLILYQGGAEIAGIKK